MIMNCPFCNSPNLTKSGKRWRTVDGDRVKVQQFLCNDCGKFTVKPVVKGKEMYIKIKEI